jgi:DNA-binding NtrC family response regulator
VAGLRILVVDDEHELRATLRRNLEQRGATTLACGTVASARAVLFDTEEHVDAAICDLLLLNGNGAELIREIVLTRPEIACVLMSGADLDLIANEGLEGFEGVEFVGKPIDVDALERAISKARARLKTERAPPLPPESEPAPADPDSEPKTQPG